MPDGTGLGKFKNHFPDRFFDVGIAEQHAVTFCAGMASRGLKPVFAVYSTFLQRGFDRIFMMWQSGIISYIWIGPLRTCWSGWRNSSRYF